jgi:hypothetical protein
MTTKVTGLLTQNTIHAFGVRRKSYTYRLLKNSQMQGAPAFAEAAARRQAKS